MVTGLRLYRYVGPPHLLAEVPPSGTGHLIRTSEDLRSWAASIDEADRAEPHTFVIDSDGVLRLAPRRSEHVSCAGGGTVLSAGELTLVSDSGGGEVTEVSNQSTGYCPDASSWPAVAAAFERAGLRHPGRFTAVMVFRRCTGCDEINVVKEDDFSCAVCGGELPASWNVDTTA